MAGHLRIISNRITKVIIAIGLALMMMPSVMAHELTEEYSETVVERYISISELKVSAIGSLRKKVYPENHKIDSDIDVNFLKHLPCSNSYTRLYLLYFSFLFYE
jgi:hypothetical protein